MKRFRFSIASLLGVVFFVAVAVAALRTPTDPWDSGIFGLTLVTLLVSVLLTVHRAERRRAYWLGFALFGWVYLAASLIPPIERRLPTLRGFVYLASQWPAAIPQGMAFADLDNDGDMDLFVSNGTAPDSGVSMNNGTGTFRGRPVGQADLLYSNLVGGTSANVVGSAANFVRIMHSLAALVLAFIGGHLSGFLYATSRRRGESE